MLSVSSAWRKSCLCQVQRKGKRSGGGGKGTQACFCSVAASVSALSLLLLVLDLLPLKNISILDGCHPSSSCLFLPSCHPQPQYPTWLCCLQTSKHLWGDFYLPAFILNSKHRWCTLFPTAVTTDNCSQCPALGLGTLSAEHAEHGWESILYDGFWHQMLRKTKSQLNKFHYKKIGTYKTWPLIHLASREISFPEQCFRMPGRPAAKAPFEIKRFPAEDQ